MAAVRIIALGIAMLLTTTTVMAQRNDHIMLSRAALDSLVHPILSTTAKGAIKGVEAHKNIGTIDNTKSHRVRFTIRNTTTESIAISNIRSTCSCLKVLEWPTTLQAAEAYDIIAEFNPRGRSGEFEVDILLYTTLDKVHPTERLTLSGYVNNSDEWSHLRYTIGGLRISRREVSITLTNSGRGEERIACANSTEHSMSISARSTVDGLSLHCEPQTLQAGEEGDIVIRYCPTTPQRDFETILMVEGAGGTASERMIRVRVEIEK